MYVCSITCYMHYNGFRASRQFALGAQVAVELACSVQHSPITSCNSRSGAGATISRFIASVGTKISPPMEPQLDACLRVKNTRSSQGASCIQQDKPGTSGLNCMQVDRPATTCNMTLPIQRSCQGQSSSVGR